MNNFIFKKGITESQIDELIHYSNTDKQVLSFTSDKTRFANRQAFNSWYLVNPTIYTLVNKKGNLCGLIWFQDETLKDHPDFDITFAIRLYAEARGKGLALEFMKKAFNTLKPQNVWLKCSADNLPAVTLYQKFGFKLVGEPDKNNKIIMLLKNHPNRF